MDSFLERMRSLYTNTANKNQSLDVAYQKNIVFLRIEALWQQGKAILSIR